MKYTLCLSKTTMVRLNRLVRDCFCSLKLSAAKTYTILSNKLQFCEFCLFHALFFQVVKLHIQPLETGPILNPDIFPHPELHVQSPSFPGALQVNYTKCHKMRNCRITWRHLNKFVCKGSVNYENNETRINRLL